MTDVCTCDPKIRAIFHVTQSSTKSSANAAAAAAAFVFQPRHVNCVVCPAKTCLLCFLCPAKTCPHGLQYAECIPVCQRTCATLYSVQSDSCGGAAGSTGAVTDCYPGCTCPAGKFMHAGVCLDASECPCLYQQEYHDAGDEITVGCNTWSVFSRCLVPA